MNEIRTVTLDVHDYDTMKSKAKAFDKFIEIVCYNGVEFHQELNKNDIRKVCKGGSVKVGEIVGNWNGEIRFTGDNEQKNFGEFVKTMIEGMDEEMRQKIIGENECEKSKCDCERGKWIEIDAYEDEMGYPKTLYKCSNCGCKADIPYDGDLNFCSNCGSKNSMEEYI